MEIARIPKAQSISREKLNGLLIYFETSCVATSSKIIMFPMNRYCNFAMS